MKILIADDDEVSRAVLKGSLEKLGHEIVECSDGEEVMTMMFRGELPQLIFLDWMMPRMNGIDACRRIRSRLDLPYTYILVITSRSERDDVLEGLRAGANDYISKPMQPQELMARIHIALRTVELYDALARQKLKMISSAKMSTLAEMAGSMAHEINNPLTIILSRAETLQREVSGNVEDKTRQSIIDTLGIIMSSVKRIAKIILALRSFASDGEKEPVEDVRVRQILEDALAFCGAKFHNHAIELRVPSVPETLRCECQPIQVTQALINILENAFLAALEMNDKWVMIDSTEDEPRVHLSVTDSGRGVAEEIRPKIMRPFFTTRPLGKGSGLGLSVAKGIIETQGGELILDTSSAHTRFVISLPKKAPAQRPSG